MKLLLVTLLAAFATTAFAAEEGQITMANPEPTTNSLWKGENLTEASVQYSSINNGSVFAAVGLMHEWDNGFALGVRGYVPMQYTKQDAAYMAQIAARFLLMNDVNQMYVEGTVTEGFFNDAVGTNSFQMIGADYGFTRKITKEISVGGVLGIDFSPTRIAQDTTASGSTFYNKIAVVGNYYF